MSAHASLMDRGSWSWWVLWGMGKVIYSRSLAKRCWGGVVGSCCVYMSVAIIHFVVPQQLSHSVTSLDDVPGCPGWVSTEPHNLLSLIRGIRTHEVAWMPLQFIFINQHQQLSSLISNINQYHHTASPPTNTISSFGTWVCAETANKIKQTSKKCLQGMMFINESCSDFKRNVPLFAIIIFLGKWYWGKQ